MQNDYKFFFMCAYACQFCCSSGVHKVCLISTLCMCMGMLHCVVCYFELQLYSMTILYARA